MSTETITKPPGADMATEERWRAWVERGVVYDRQLKKRAIVALVVIAAFLALGLLLIR
jgi:hypothetical protein